jgi:glutamate synthase domain-containing protein 2
MPVRLHQCVRAHPVARGANRTTSQIDVDMTRSMASRPFRRSVRRRSFRVVRRRLSVGRASRRSKGVDDARGYTFELPLDAARHHSAFARKTHERDERFRADRRSRMRASSGVGLGSNQNRAEIVDRTMKGGMSAGAIVKSPPRHRFAVLRIGQNSVPSTIRRGPSQSRCRSAAIQGACIEIAS